MINAIEIRSMSRTYARTTALDNISLTVPSTSICGLVGRNGAGKTTLMAILAGQDRPSTGTAHVFRERPLENESVLSKISFVRDNQRYPDDYKLHHVLRIAPDFAPNRSADIAAELVEGFRIPNKTAIKKFSRGQLSSVAIVLGVASRCSLTLLDEPYLGLDVTARSLFHDVLLRDYTAHPRTIVLSTHLIEESEALFDRVVIVDRGKIVVDCDSDESRNMALTVSRLADSVDQFTTGRRVFLSRTVGGMKSATVSGTIDNDIRIAASTMGVVVSPASLPELVAAFGADNPKELQLTKGALA